MKHSGVLYMEGQVSGTSSPVEVWMGSNGRSSSGRMSSNITIWFIGLGPRSFALRRRGLRPAPKEAGWPLRMLDSLMN